ncbi:hypothetical protein EC844_10566 [Acinetobacter calcoaceticus]|uniref:2'-5' RNA ligase superfamily protein n=1 Tax=Acinetobacter calcoaceticus TaxID=471 RepID=A0A4R1Y7T3_ACICA|nr:hypothetical protein EC844_10566 [Acinetobacter calcoaceticus]
MFLNPQNLVIPTLVRDYPEWHHARCHYALWYIEIDQPELIAYLDQLRLHFADLLLQPNQRQYHISVYVCGFLTELAPRFNDDFHPRQMQQQIQYLHQHIQQRSLGSFQLKLTQLNSFDSALIVELLDPVQCLGQIRQGMALYANEIAALQYCPHITLGLYREAYAAEKIYARMQSILQRPFEITVDQLKFGYYQAQQLQGPLYAQYSVHLDQDQACCN